MDVFGFHTLAKYTYYNKFGCSWLGVKLKKKKHFHIKINNFKLLGNYS